jgi:hypothetical protein
MDDQIADPTSPRIGTRNGRCPQAGNGTGRLRERTEEPLLLQVMFTIRSKRQLMDQLEVARPNG